MYVDESGDPGRYNGKNTPHFILSGLVMPAQDWALALARITSFREEIKTRTGLRKREEIHSSELVRPSKIAAYKAIHKSARVQILRDFVQKLSHFFPHGHLLNVCLDKQQVPTQTDYAQLAWQRLLDAYNQFLGQAGQAGFVVADDTETNYLRALLRTRQQQAGAWHIVEDVFQRSSTHSYFIQAVDAVTYCLYRQEYPKASVRKFNLHQLFATLEPLLWPANAADSQGIVRQ